MSVISKDSIIAVIGLGYVGLPLAVEFGRSRKVVGYDIDESRIDELRNGYDRTRETTAEELQSATRLAFTADADQLANADVYIVTVPTPIDSNKRPNLKPLESASSMIGTRITPGNVVIFESTVYPGCTEEICVPIIERASGLACTWEDMPPTSADQENKGFYAGYSPERINPGDRDRRLKDITKVTSGSSYLSSVAIDDLYAEIVTAGTHRAPSIKVAEAAKVIENTQRDLNIALVNELSVIFERLSIDTEAVLNAAGTKWNFLPFKPGLVGGHCIGVDPYYLTHRSQMAGYEPEVILAGRRLNDSMGQRVAQNMVKQLSKIGKSPSECNVRVLGATFKENCPDLRNTKVTDIISELKTFGVTVSLFDPVADSAELELTFPEISADSALDPKLDGLIIAVAHNEFVTIEDASFERMLAEGCVIYDLKHIKPPSCSTMRL